jgi:hypothetical protein
MLTTAIIRYHDISLNIKWKASETETHVSEKNNKIYIWKHKERPLLNPTGKWSNMKTSEESNMEKHCEENSSDLYIKEYLKTKEQTEGIKNTTKQKEIDHTRDVQKLLEIQKQFDKANDGHVKKSGCVLTVQL